MFANIINPLIETPTPSIPSTLRANPDLKQYLDPIKEVIEVREGRRGDPLDQSVTFRDLLKNGALPTDLSGRIYARFFQNNYQPTFITPSPSFGDELLPPPAPTGLAAVGALANVLVTFDAIDNTVFRNYAYTEIWRSGTNDIGTAVKVGTTSSTIYTDNLGQTGLTRYYWARHVSTAGIPGPFNGTAGTSASTGFVTTNDLTDLLITANKIAAGAISAYDKFGAGIRPVGIGSALPTLPSATYPTGAAFFLTTDAKLYRVDTTGNVWTSAVPTTDLTGQITSTQITDGAISTPKLAANSVTATNIAASAVTSSAIAANAITAGAIAAGAVVAGKIGTNAIVAGDGVIANAAISTALIQDAAITNAKIGLLAVDTGRIADLAVTAAKIASATITAAQIALATITAAQIALATITNAQIADATITGAKIASATIALANINTATVGTLSALSANLGTITAGNITLDTTGYIKGGQTAYNTGAGFFLGYSGGAYKFSIGNPAGDYLTWDGTSLLYNRAPNIQTFNAGGTWTKPPVGSIALIEGWGAGGGGGKGGGTNGCGGGGGGYGFVWIALSALGATETVTIGTGGAGSTGGGAGGTGGSTSFGSWLTATGGTGGLDSLTTGAGSGGAFWGVSAGALYDGGRGGDNTGPGNTIYGGAGGQWGNAGSTATSKYGGNGGINGGAGATPGGGGAGGPGGGTNGGAGGGGRVRVTVYI